MMPEEQPATAMVLPLSKHPVLFAECTDRVIGRMGVLAAAAGQLSPQLHRAASQTIADMHSKRVKHDISWQSFQHCHQRVVLRQNPIRRLRDRMRSWSVRSAI